VTESLAATWRKLSGLFKRQGRDKIDRRAGDYGRIDRDIAEAALAHSLGAVEAGYRCRTAVEARSAGCGTRRGLTK
jgi:hypothetical protein